MTPDPAPEDPRVDELAEALAGLTWSTVNLRHRELVRTAARDLLTRLDALSPPVSPPPGPVLDVEWLDGEIEERDLQAVVATAWGEHDRCAEQLAKAAALREVRDHHLPAGTTADDQPRERGGDEEKP